MLQVRDNWGDLPTDWDPNSLDFFVARCAWRVMLEYQRQLYEDVDFSRLEQITKVGEGRSIGFAQRLKRRSIFDYFTRS